jgi:ABC-type Mn2+/Zn2+ transport system permease subunit
LVKWLYMSAWLEQMLHINNLSFVITSIQWHLIHLSLFSDIYLQRVWIASNFVSVSAASHCTHVSTHQGNFASGVVSHACLQCICQVSVLHYFNVYGFGVRGREVLHLFSIPHVQTQSNRFCNSLLILLWLMLPRYHFVQMF